MNHSADTTCFRIDLVNLCLWRSTQPGAEERLKLTPKTFDVLRYLVENAGRLVTHDELLQALWPDVHVQPEVLKSHVLAIRTAFGEKAEGGRFIQTERGRGYRFVGPITGLKSAINSAKDKDEIRAFAGRAAPMRELLTALQGAISGKPQAVFISGEAGIGKTALIQQFLAQAPNRSTLSIATGQCIESFAGAEPYYSIFEALSALIKAPAGASIVQTLATIAPTWAAQMPDQIPAKLRANTPPQPVEGTRSRMIREASNLIETLATDRPLVLVLEDLHWADYATIDFLSAICRRDSAAKLMLVATYRPEDLNAARHPLKQMTRDLALRKFCREIVLDALSESEIADMVACGSNQPVSEELAPYIKERCGGNPLFIRITLDYLVERGIIERTSDGWRQLVLVDQFGFETPPDLGRLIETRIEDLTKDQLRVLEAGSVVGIRFDPVSAARAADMDEHGFEAICEDLCRSGSFIRKDELAALPNHSLVRSYAFNHAVLQRTLYDQILESRRVMMHSAVGKRLEEIYPDEQRNAISMQLAQHFASAREWPRALHYLRFALHIATSRFARRDALAILDRAAEMAANLPESARIAAELEFLEHRSALLAAGRDAQAEDSYQLLVSKAAQYGDIDAHVRALLGFSYPLSWHDLDRSLRVLDEVLILCESLADPIKRDAARVIAYARRIWGSGWSFVDAPLCEQAYLRLREKGDALTVGRAKIYFSMICLLSARYRESLELISEGYLMLREASENLIGTDLARAAWMHHVGVAWSLLNLGDFGGALAAFDNSVATYEKNNDDAAAQSLKIYRGVIFFHAMDYESVLESCEPVASQLVKPLANGHSPELNVFPLEQRLALIFCGLAEVELGHTGAAHKYFSAAEKQMAQQSVLLDWYWKLALEWGFANLHIAEGDHIAAQERATRFSDLAEQTGERALQALARECQARAALSRNDAKEALHYIMKALSCCEGVDVPLAEWRVYATSAVIYKALGESGKADVYAQLSAGARQQRAETLPQDHFARIAFEHHGKLASLI